MIGANLRFGIGASGNVTSNATKVFQCHPGGVTEATVIFSLGALGMGANIILMTLILAKRQLRRWSQGLLFHQAMVDCARAAILLPLGSSILNCEPVNKCSLVETAFLLLVTVSTVNMLTTVLNDSPVFPDGDEEADLTAPLLMDSPQCVLFGTFMIWFASITINLGPTFLSGALAANAESSHNAPSCPLVHGPFRHYILNALWIVINIICIALTLFHLRKLHRDLTKANVEAVRVAGLVTTLVNVTGGHQGATNAFTTEDGDTRNGTTPKRTGALEEHRKMRNYLRRMEHEGVQRVKMFLVITAAYVLFWGPLFFVTLVHHPAIGNPIGYEVTLHIAYVHAFVNPALFLLLHRGLRQGMSDVCCGCCESIARWILGSTTGSMQNVQLSLYEPPMNLPSPPDPPMASVASLRCNLTDVAFLQPPPPPTAKHLLVDNSIVIPPDPWSLVSRPKSTSSLYEEELSRRPSFLLPSPAELNDLQTSSDSSE
ncbi:hypothetical protein ALC56_14539 [Trachymyrmex septentrionalis]|uniref:G-protein coupled receptors family 1 profile domain-containing protein n=1 Tax=Trachymyrmex septentrionalis TaxID=34720 RepID=A0A195ETB4_9HYME|nr:PREDICTED: uncharacterized protein LOC108755581 [Trachymyrmex septentrionalis]KYN31152.1 hypothetical protein ALC56_14539 [Trachymyrmex septentrionalis]